MGGLKFMFPPQTPEQDSESLETILEVLGGAAASETANKYIKNTMIILTPNKLWNISKVCVMQDKLWRSLP
jgi:hypothetical protein